MHEGMLSDYRHQNWDNAIQLSTSLMKYNSELKKYYEAMIERVNELRQTNLPVSWDGVYRATSK